jgi:DNA-binding beta-propeller fold protein YncE
MFEGRIVDEQEFLVHLPVDEAQTFYIVAQIRAFRLGNREVRTGDRVVQLLCVFTEDDDLVALSERATVATVYSFAQFLAFDEEHHVVLSDPDRAFSIAYGMKNNFTATDGTLSKVIQSSPNGLETNSYALFNFLSNLLYYGLTSEEVYTEFTRRTHSHFLLQALFQLAQEPFTEVEGIYHLISDRQQIYTPSLPDLQPPATPLPHQWTLTVKVNDSGAENFLIAGVGYVDFDKNDRLWLTNNVRQGTPNSSTFCVVLEPDGSPAPFSPLFGGGLLGAGFGVAADPAGETIYFGNFGWGPTEWNPQHGSISAFSHRGEVLSPPNGYTPELSSVQGMQCDRQGNLWMASWGTQEPLPPTDSRFDFKGRRSAVVVYLGGDPEKALVHHFDSPYHLTFDVTVDDQGNAYVSNSGDKDHQIKSSVHKLRIVDGELKLLRSWCSDGYESLRQVAVSPWGEVFVVAVATSRVIRFSNDLECLGELKKNIHGPWGIVFDPAGTLYVSNFSRERDFEDVGHGAVEHEEVFGPYGVTVIRDGDEDTARLMTLPTGGDEVTLANGLPLYGSNGLKSYSPLMRLTGSRIDRAGNLWACNNWKPSADIDVRRGDPGGDGLVAFVGVAAPRV